MNPNAIELLEQNLDKVDWDYLSSNPNAIDILKQNKDKINWYYLSLNPSIFEVNYEFLKQRIDVFREELMMKAWHPSRIEKWLDSGMDMEYF